MDVDARPARAPAPRRAQRPPARGAGPAPGRAASPQSPGPRQPVVDRAHAPRRRPRSRTPRPAAGPRPPSLARSAAIEPELGQRGGQRGRVVGRRPAGRTPPRSRRECRPPPCRRRAARAPWPRPARVPSPRCARARPARRRRPGVHDLGRGARDVQTLGHPERGGVALQRRPLLAVTDQQHVGVGHAARRRSASAVTSRSKPLIGTSRPTPAITNASRSRARGGRAPTRAPGAASRSAAVGTPLGTTANCARRPMPRARCSSTSRGRERHDACPSTARPRAPASRTARSFARPSSRRRCGRAADG